MDSGERLSPAQADRASRIVEALWPARGAAPRVLLTAAAADDGRYSGPGSSLKDRDLAKAIKERDGALVLVAVRPSPTLLRALRGTPVDLLVLLGDGDDLSPADRSALATHVLGPNAVLHVEDLGTRTPGRAVACAHAPDELEGITRALTPRVLPLRLSPTPAWLPTLLRHPSLAGLSIAGTLDRDALHGGWVEWVRERDAPAVLVPLGVDAPALDTDDDTILLATVAAHALERRTGPVFPAPRVLAGVLDGLEHRGETTPPTAQQLAIWTQARRALPITGAAVGMVEPDGDLAMQAPTAAFLAQRVLLRARAHDAAMSRGAPDLEPLDDDGQARASELLRNAAEILTDQESKVVLRGFGFDVTRQAVANSASGAAGFADRIGYPVVLKALSPDLRRRTDVGGVMLSLRTASAVRRAYAAIMDNVEREAPTARVDGVVVAEMVEDGVDIRCGARRLSDDQVVVYGRIEGASAPVEAALGLLPLSPEDALALAHAVLSRAPMPALRRQTDPDVPGLATLFCRLSALFSRTDARVLSVDLGPVRMLERGLVTLDARITQQAHLEGL